MTYRKILDNAVVVRRVVHSTVRCVAYHETRYYADRVGHVRHRRDSVPTPTWRKWLVGAVLVEPAVTTSAGEQE